MHVPKVITSFASRYGCIVTIPQVTRQKSGMNTIHFYSRWLDFPWNNRKSSTIYISCVPSNLVPPLEMMEGVVDQVK